MENKHNESIVPTITFIAVTLTRLAYLSDCEFLIRYLEIFDTYGWKKIRYNNTNNRCDRTTHRRRFNPSFLNKIKPIHNSVLVNIKYTNIRNIFNSVDSVHDFLPYAKYINYVNNEANLSKYIPNEESIPDEEDNIPDEESVQLEESSNVLQGEADVIPEQSILKRIIPVSRMRTEIRRQLDERIKYISLSWSEYSTIYIVADKMMNSIWIIFKGTGTTESSFSYINHKSIKPTIIKETDEGFLIGIYNLINENIHIIIESIRYLILFLNPNNNNPENKIKLFTTGHSLGGAMATIFSFLWAQLIDGIYGQSPSQQANAEFVRQHNDTTDQKIRDRINVIANLVEVKDNILTYPENLLAKVTKEIVCITVGAPKVLNLNVVRKFQQYMSCGYILFKRIINEDDPIPKLPPSLLGYYHPDYDLRSQYKPLINCDNDILICIDKVCKIKPYNIKCKLMTNEADVNEHGDNEDEIFDRYFPAKCVGKLCSKANMFAHTNYYYISYIMKLTVPLTKSLITYGDIKRDQAGETSCFLKQKTGWCGKSVFRVIFGSYGNNIINRRYIFFHTDKKNKKNNLNNKQDNLINTDTFAQLLDLSRPAELNNLYYSATLPEINTGNSIFEGINASNPVFFSTDSEIICAANGGFNKKTKKYTKRTTKTKKYIKKITKTKKQKINKTKHKKQKVK